MCLRNLLSSMGDLSELEELLSSFESIIQDVNPNLTLEEVLAAYIQSARQSQAELIIS